MKAPLLAVLAVLAARPVIAQEAPEFVSFLDRVETHLATGDVDGVARALDRWIRRRGDDLYRTDPGHGRPVRDRCHDLIASRQALRTRYRFLFDAEAENRLAAAIARGDVAAVDSVRRDLRHTSSGGRATLWLARYRMDLGWHDCSRPLLTDLLRHAPEPGVDPVDARRRLAACRPVGPVDRQPLAAPTRWRFRRAGVRFGPGTKVVFGPDRLIVEPGDGSEALAIALDTGRLLGRAGPGPLPEPEADAPGDPITVLRTGDPDSPHLTAADRRGRILWRRRIPPAPHRGGCDVLGDVVLWMPGGGAIEAFDLATGARRWRHRYRRGERTASAGWAVRTDDGLLVTPGDGRALLCLDPAGGRLIWHRALEVRSHDFLVAGQGVPHREGLLLPGTGRRPPWSGPGIFQVDDDGRILSHLPLDAAGDLLLHRNVLVVVGPEAIEGYHIDDLTRRGRRLEDHRWHLAKARQTGIAGDYDRAIARASSNDDWFAARLEKADALFDQGQLEAALETWLAILEDGGDRRLRLPGGRPIELRRHVALRIALLFDFSRVDDRALLSNRCRGPLDADARRRLDLLPPALVPPALRTD